MKSITFASIIALASRLVSEETGSVTIWDRPAAKASVDGTDERALQPLTDEQKAARTEIAKQIHKILVDNMDNGNPIGAFLTPSENGRTVLLALSLPMDPLTFPTEDGDTVSTNKFVMNLNVAIPGEKAEKKGAVVVETKALTFAELRKQTEAARKAAKK